MIACVVPTASIPIGGERSTVRRRIASATGRMHAGNGGRSLPTLASEHGAWTWPAMAASADSDDVIVSSRSTPRPFAYLKTRWKWGS